MVGTAEKARGAVAAEVVPQGPFSLAATERFLTGWAGTASGAETPAGHVHLAFVPDGGQQAAGVCLRQPGGLDTPVEVTVTGAADPQAALVQAVRAVSLDVDGRGWPPVGERDPVLGDLQQRHHWLRPVGFWSPFEAGAWLLIGHRIRMTQAAAVKARMGAELGEQVEVCGQALHAFPAPSVVAGLTDVRGLPERKVASLRALGAAASDGRLDGDRLRSLPEAEVLADLQQLPGVGPFTAEGILIRGAMAPDVLSLHEPRLPHAVALAYALDADPGPDALLARAQEWSPYRSWATVLLRVALEDRLRTDA